MSSTYKSLSFTPCHHKLGALNLLPPERNGPHRVATKCAGDRKYEKGQGIQKVVALGQRWASYGNSVLYLHTYSFSAGAICFSSAMLSCIHEEPWMLLSWHLGTWGCVKPWVFLCHHHRVLTSSHYAAFRKACTFELSRFRFKSWFWLCLNCDLVQII